MRFGLEALVRFEWLSCAYFGIQALPHRELWMWAELMEGLVLVLVLVL